MGNINGTNGNVEEQAKVIGEIFENKQEGNVQNQAGNVKQGYNGELGQGEYAGGVVGNTEGIYKKQETFGIGGIQGDTIKQQAEITNGGITENAGTIGGVMQMPKGYTGGFIGDINQVKENNSNNYVGKLVENEVSTQGTIQNLGYDASIQEDASKNLPVKQGFFGKMFSIITGKAKVQLEISQKEEKVLTEVHDFLFQNMSIKGFFDILKIGKNKDR